MEFPFPKTTSSPIPTRPLSPIKGEKEKKSHLAELEEHSEVVDRPSPTPPLSPIKGEKEKNPSANIKQMADGLYNLQSTPLEKLSPMNRLKNQ